DGQRVTLAPSTKVTYKLNKHEKKDQKNANQEESPLGSLDAINLQTFMHYEGSRQVDGAILASKVEFQHAELEDGESKLWARLRPKIKEPDYSGFRSGELRMERAKYKLIPSKEAQDYIEKIGQSVIPAAQRNLPDGDPLKIPFHFYLVQAKS